MRPATCAQTATSCPSRSRADGPGQERPLQAAEAEEIKKQVTAQADRLKELEAKETELQAKIQEIMYTIPR